ncbi:plasmid recombination protein [Duganella qianjiadongensis]|uniref:Plasmid recombination enzyme n=1 Tax=Duganella qianjiadongensis TaxID=2692176 RepID=A0ABW9VKZ6_9BURK|nr:plasmid recombination protein [Duganella qianjiadongensis]MYM39173.1 hypothetical protein [Duganella qianjiadongensis]
MTAESHFLRIKKLTGAGIVRAAAKHNLREIAAELGADGHIDVSRIADNVVLAGAASAELVATASQNALDEAGITKLRRDAVRAIEIVFSLPPATTTDQRQFFADATNWARDYFAVPVLSSVIHNDESAPHCHVLLLPLVRGRMVGSDLIGGRQRLVAMQDDFYNVVASKYGLSKATPRKRISTAERRAAIRVMRELLLVNSGLQDAVIDALLVPHGRDPLPLMLALGISQQEPIAKKGGFVELMTKPCKPERKSRNPIGFASEGRADEEQTLCSVGFAFSAPSSPATKPAYHPTEASPPAPAESAPEASTELVRIELVDAIEEAPKDDQQHAEGVAISGHTRESFDQPSELWNSDTGEWMQPEPLKTPRKRLAEQAVQAALLAVGKQAESPNRRLYRH